MMQVTEADIAEHVRVRLQKEQEEKARKQKEKQEAHLHTVIRVATKGDLEAQIGAGERFFDLVDFERASIVLGPLIKTAVLVLLRQRIGRLLVTNCLAFRQRRLWVWLLLL